MRHMFTLFTGLVLLVGSFSTSAGTFVMQSTWFEEQVPNQGWTTVMVGATARYEGTPDLNDDKWIVNSRLHYMNTYTDGAGYAGSGVHEGKIITATPRQYGASAGLADCSPTGGSTGYRGKGQAAIYHQFTPELSDELWAYGNTTCENPDSDGGGDGTNESPPGGNTTDPGGSSPIVIDLDRNGFRFTDLEGGVAFDIEPGDEVERVSWTAGAGDGFLALDRNFDGRIEGGGELFGNFTVQPESDSPNGYAALALYDHPDYGGDGDGRITVGDSIFWGLRVWIDADHDGYSDPDEIHPLAVLGIESIGLDPVESRRRDRHGNELRYVGLVRLTKGTTHSADVFLLTE